MGLDMYLYGLDDEDLETFTKVKKLIQEYDGGYYTDEIKDLLNDFWDKEGDDLAYWRKANAIHKFFCDRGEVIDKNIYYITGVKNIHSIGYLALGFGKEKIIISSVKGWWLDCYRIQQ